MRLSPDRKITITLGLVVTLLVGAIGFAFQTGAWTRGIEKDIEELKQSRCQCDFSLRHLVPASSDVGGN